MNPFEATYGELTALRELHKDLDAEGFSKLVKDRLEPAMEKPFVPELPEIFGFQKFNFGELDKANDIIKGIFGKECGIKTSKTFSLAGGASLASEISLKHTRSGKYQIDGSLFECLHINVMNLVGVMESKNGARTFLVKAHHSNFLVCLIELKKNQLIGKQNSQKEFRLFLHETFKNMEPSSQEIQDWDLWVPNFRLRIACDKGSSETWKQGDKQDNLVSFLEMKLESRSDGELIKRQAGDRSIVLSEGFIVGLMDTTHEDKLDLPVFASLVTPDYFVPS
jgi:hypothetical protein